MTPPVQLQPDWLDPESFPTPGFGLTRESASGFIRLPFLEKVIDDLFPAPQSSLCADSSDTGHNSDLFQIDRDVLGLSALIFNFRFFFFNHLPFFLGGRLNANDLSQASQSFGSICLCRIV